MKKSAIAAALLALTATTASANEAGDILVRVGATTVAPDSGFSTIYAADMTTHLSSTTPALAASVENDTQLGLTLSYFWTDNIAFELLAATPFEHEIRVNSGNDVSLTLGTTKHLPPTVSAVYYFDAGSDKFKPYVGAGINYTVFFEDNFDSAMAGDAVQLGALGGNSIESLAGALGLPAGTASVGLRAKDLKLKNSWGLAAQIGFDYQMNNNMIFNASARYMDIDTTATFTATALEVPGKVDVAIDPWVYSVTLGFKF